MGKITRPVKLKLKKPPKRPAWLYPEGTRYDNGQKTYVVSRSYGTHVQPPEDPEDNHVVTETRSARYWEEVNHSG